MKPECEAAVRAAAGDRELTKADIAGIESRLHQSAKTLRRQNPAAWDAMQPAGRIKAAAKLARSTHLEQMAKAHSIALRRVAIKVQRDTEIAAVPKGRQLDALNTSHFRMGGRGGTTSLESEIDAEMARVKTMLTGKEERALDDPAMSDKVARAIRGEETGDPEAAKLAQRVTDMLEQNRQRMEDVGIPISPLENWHYPQHQEWTKLAASKEQEWVDDHVGWIDHREYTNRDGSPMTPDQIEAMLHESWMTIHTNGANKRAEQTAFSGGGKVGATLNAPRQLHYKDAASWKAAMTKYGVSNRIGQILRAHMARTGRMIAIAAREGNLADRDVQQRAQQALFNDLSVAETAKQKTKLEAEHKKFLLKWNVQQHGIGQPANARVATVMNFARNLMSSSMLGSLVSQQPSDSLMALTLLKAWGFDVGGKGRFLAKFGEGLAGSRLKEDMRRLQTWTDNSHAQTTRFVDDEFSNRASRFLNGGVYVASGMRRADFATTGAIVDSVLGTIGRDTRKFANVADMPAGDANYAQRFGITQGHWDVMRAAELDHGLEHGNGYVTPQGIYAIPDEKLAALAQQRAAAVNAGLKERIAQYKGRSAQESEWVAKRVENLSAIKVKAQETLAKMAARASVRIGHAEGAADARAELLRAQIERAEVETDINRYLATQAQQGKLAAYLDEVEDGANRERQVIRQRIHPDNLSDAVIENFGSNEGIDAAVNRSTQSFAKDVGTKGEQLGQRRAQVEARIDAAQKAIAAKAEDAAGRLADKAGDFGKRIDGLTKETAAFADKMKARAASRADRVGALEKEVTSVTAQSVRRLKDDTVRKLMAVYQETLHTAGRGFSGSTLTEKARLGLLTQDAGTPLGEALRMLYLVRQVPFGMAMTHLWDVPRGLTGWKAKAVYVTKYVAGQMAATAFAIQAKHIIAGEDPEDMTKSAFIAKCLAGAGVGPMLATILFGDLGEGDNEAGKFLGPGANAAGQVYGLAARGITELHGGPATGKDNFDAEKYSSQWLSFARHNAVPFGNMWWTKAVVNHMLYQQAQEQLSPGYNERVQRRLEHENRNTWWDSGDLTPQRAPDFGAATGQPNR